MTVPFLELEDLEVRLGGRPVLKGLSGSLSGRSIGLLGPNGAGKTTLINTLLGFHRPVRGTARVLGHDLRDGVGELRELVGYMPENDSFIASMTPVRFVRMLAEISGLPAAAALERTHEALFYVGLGEARYRKLGSFSTGMKQLVKLAQALASSPRILLLDEPTNGLDPPARERMVRLIQEIRDAGEVRLVVSSHLLRDVEQCCDQVLVLKNGEVAVVSDLSERGEAHRRFLELEVRGGEEGFVAALEALGCECAVNGGRRMKLVLPEGVEVRDLFALAAERQVQIRRLTRRRDSLEDIFLKAMEGEVGLGGL